MHVLCASTMEIVCMLLCTSSDGNCTNVVYFHGGNCMNHVVYLIDENCINVFVYFHGGNRMNV